MEGYVTSRSAGIMGGDIGRSIFPIALLVAGILSGCFFAGPTRVASIGAGGQTQHTEANEYPYYVEFRVAVDGVYGHSYIAYGRLASGAEGISGNFRPTSSLSLTKDR